MMCLLCRCGVQAAAVAPGDTVAIVGAGPIGLAALQTAALLSPRATYVLDINDARLQVRGAAAGLLVKRNQRSNPSVQLLVNVLRRAAPHCRGMHRWQCVPEGLLT